MDVTDVLRDRMQEPAGLQRMVTVSLGLHLLAATIVVFAPGRWIGHMTEAPRKVMTISIAGGGEGPRNGGLTTSGGRPVQVQTPPDEIPKREPIRPPAAKAPEMTVPLKGAKPIKASPAPVVSTGRIIGEGARSLAPAAVTAHAPCAPAVTTQVRPPTCASPWAAASKSDVGAPIAIAASSASCSLTRR